MKKSDLAKQYFPYYKGKSALNRLMQWINSKPELVQALALTGYHNRQRNLTPRQVELIYDHIGIP